MGGRTSRNRLADHFAATAIRDSRPARKALAGIQSTARPGGVGTHRQTLSELTYTTTETELLLDDSLDPVTQEGTYVHRQHRGRRLGVAVKVANLQRLQRDYPGRPFVHTTNAETNEHMVSINVDLGFEVKETLTDWVMDIGG